MSRSQQLSSNSQSDDKQDQDKNGDGPGGKAGAKGNAESSGVLLGEEISMNRIVDFLRDQQKTSYQRETEFIFEKQQMATRINQLSAQLKAQENINNDLIRRIKMLEFSLRQERIKYAKLAQSHNPDAQSIGNTDIIGQVLQKANLNTNLYERVAKRRAKAQRPLLLKFLQEIGYDDIFNIDEVNEIKTLYDKAQEEMKQNFEAEVRGDGKSYQDKLEERMLDNDTQINEKDGDKNNQTKFQVVDGSEVELKKDEQSKKMIHLKYDIKGHFSSVRDIVYMDSMNVLASVSEDFQVHLWNLKSIQDNTNVASLKTYQTLRGHRGEVYTVAALNSPVQKDEKNGSKLNILDRIIFTAGEEGIIKVWQVPPVPKKEDNYPPSNDQSNQIGQWGSNEDFQSQSPIWCLKYNKYSNKLLAIKHDNIVQVWDSSELITQLQTLDKQQSADDSKASTIKRDFSQVKEPMKQFPPFEVNGLEPSVMTGAWLPTDHNSLVTGYENGHLVFYDLSRGSITNQHHIKPLKEEDTSITSIIAHELEPIVVVGLQSGQIATYDYKQQKQLLLQDINDVPTQDSRVQSISYINNYMKIVVGYSSGQIGVYDNELKLICLIDKAHLQKQNDAVNSIISLSDVAQKDKGASSDNQAASSIELPFFISCGADGKIKIFEHNIYEVNDGEKGKKDEKVENNN